MTSIAPTPLSSQLQLVSTDNFRTLSIGPALLKQATDIPFNEPAPGPPDSVYADVVVKGQVVAKLFNSGTADIPLPSTYAKVKNLPSLNNNKLIGPNGAQEIATEIAAALGGSVVKASTAQTQQQWLGSDYAKSIPKTLAWSQSQSAILAQVLGQES